VKRGESGRRLAVPDNPLVQALKNKQAAASQDPQALLEFILAHFNLTPKDEGGEEKPEMVMTQESHTP
jgi:hypothetical protein